MPEALLGDLLGSRGITYGVVKPGDNTPGGVPLMKAADVGNGRVNINPAFRISPDKHQEHCRTELAGGELLITLVGTPGQCAVAPKEVKGFNVVRAVGVFTVKEGISAKYVMYAIQSPPSQNHILNICNTTVQATLNLGDLKGLPLRIPPLQEQNGIAHILGTLDDKIELNRKTNETLEGMAKALFKSWFVDFDPVREKADGRPTGLPVEISDLFPDSFEDSELGEIPSGWSVEALSDIAQISTGKRPVSVAESRSSANNIPVYGGAGVMGYTCSALTDGEPILTTGRVGTLGVVNRVIEKVWISDNTLIINPGRINFVYVYFFLLRQDLKSLNRGSTQPLLSQTELKSLPIARPPASVLSVFCELTQHWQERQSTLLKENVNIKALLDTLLPKLISGEIRIPDAEKMLEEVGV